MKKAIIRRASPQNESILPDNLHPVLRRIYNNRNIFQEKQLDKSINNLLPFNKLSQIENAAQVIYEHLVQSNKIVIIGDFDADGATSTAVAVKCLKMFGAYSIEFLVPNRFKYGYGLTPEIVKEAEQIFSPKLIITVDNGISSIEGVNTANALDIDVVVTDHHLAGQELPNAKAIVNPNQPDDQFDSKNLAGVGVIFYVMLALRSLLREKNWFAVNNIKEPNFSSVLDIVALGTIADVVPLDLNNRILVNQGLKRIRAGHACPGIQALIKVSNRTAKNLIASDMGFCLGPRLNAAGRLEDMSVGINCLLSESIEQAREYATQLDDLNRTRREIEGQMQQEALSSLKELHLDDTTIPMGMCLYDPHWHQGVIGILASRIKDKFHRPVIVFADNEDDEIKGSARSIPHLHIRDILDSIATKHPSIIHKFGGHAMAAGLSIAKSNLEKFQECFNREVEEVVKPEYLDQVIYSDGEISEQEFSLELASLIQQAEPWGQEFPEPVFDGKFKLIQQRIVGEKHLKLKLRPESGNQEFDAIAFNTISHEDNVSPFNVGDRINAVFKLDINNFRGQTSLQLMIEYLEPAIAE